MISVCCGIGMNSYSSIHIDWEGKISGSRAIISAIPYWRGKQWDTRGNVLYVHAVLLIVLMFE